MIERRDGVIVNVIGVAGERPRQNYIAGTTGNAALMAFTRTLGGDSMDYGVRVVGINPGQIETDRLRTRLQKKAQDAFGDPARWKELLEEPDGPAAGNRRPRRLPCVAARVVHQRHHHYCRCGPRRAPRGLS